MELCTYMGPLFCRKQLVQGYGIVSSKAQGLRSSDKQLTGKPFSAKARFLSSAVLILMAPNLRPDPQKIEPPNRHPTPLWVKARSHPWYPPARLGVSF